MKITLTAVFEEDPEGGYTGFIEEIPGVKTQGETEKEVKQNLLDALKLSMEYHREKSEKSLRRKKKGVIRREKFKLVSV